MICLSGRTQTRRFFVSDYLTIAGLIVCSSCARDETEAQAAGQRAVDTMSAKCNRVAESASVRIEAVGEAERAVVEAEFTHNYTDALWVPQEPVPSYRIDAQTRSVIL